MPLPVFPDPRVAHRPPPTHDLPVVDETTDDGRAYADEASVLEEVNSLARRSTTGPWTHGDPGRIFDNHGDETLDPDSPLFDAKRWARAFYQTQVEALGGLSPNSAGLAFRNLSVGGQSVSDAYQRTVGTAAYGAIESLRSLLGLAKPQQTHILRDLEGLLESGEMLCVLGPPGSGCSTLLKTIAGETYGFEVADSSHINYQGLSHDDICKIYKGEAIYMAEVDHHFPRLTVGETLYFAARARCPQNIKHSKRQYAEHLRDVVMAMLGISHTKNTRVGNDYLRGVSGGERKRVSIAEAVLSYSPWQCWDNSTRGLDAANAVNFCRTLRSQADIFGNSVCVAIYQAPQEAYEAFDKVILLYQGRQIYFGRTADAKTYFEGLGFECPEQQTTPDFLTSMTSAAERTTQHNWSGAPPPRSADEFAAAWKASPERQRLLAEIESFESRFPIGGDVFKEFEASRAAAKSRRTRAASPRTLSYPSQVSLNLWRSWKLLRADPMMTITMLLTNFLRPLSSPQTSSSMDRRSLDIFFTILINALGSVLEILTLYDKRAIIEKHARYALYRPSAEAFASMVSDLPYKLLNSLFINMVVYFMANLRRVPGPFFFFLLFSFTITMTMSMIFRTLGSATKTVSQALAPSAVLLLMLMLFNGYALPPQYTRDWIGWLRWISPAYYTQESLCINEFVGRQYECSSFIPSLGPGETPTMANVCSVPGSMAGEPTVNGARYIEISYGFIASHRWRNYGILLAITFFFFGLHLVALDLVSSERSKGEMLVFPRGIIKKRRGEAREMDEEGAMEKGADHQSSNGTLGDDDDPEVRGIERQTSIFHWRDVCYNVSVKGEDRVILDHVDGWVQPGTLTALMGVSGAGKTSLLDVLASRMLVDGKLRDSSFQRKTGYVTQQDLHLATSTVREALRFSALLRQPARYTRQEKLDYVNEVIRLVDLNEYADAVIGMLGEGLNVEQRKRLTIGIELAARPELLLFLDEPTSGLDSQTSWTICDLMQKLTRNGQAILCTIHQPSAALFQRFDRLLLLAKGGRTTYFGPVGRNSTVLLDYLARNGAEPFVAGANPAEYMLDAISKGPQSSSSSFDNWHDVWKASPEYQDVRQRLDELEQTRGQPNATDDPSLHAEFAASVPVQFVEVTRRAFQQYWRTPTYIFSKFVLTAGAALFIGLSQVNADVTQRGLFNQMLCVCIFLVIFSQIISQLMPMFVKQRDLYEARERPARAYSWKAFLFADIVVEMAWNSYYPMGFYRYAALTGLQHSRAINVFLLVWAFFVYASSFGHLMIAGIETETVAGGIFNLFFILMFAFSGIIGGPNALPGFWIFMYRVNPLTYVVEGFLTTTLGNTRVQCIASEMVSFEAPGGKTCGEYAGSFVRESGGYLGDSNATGVCDYCGMSQSDTFLASMNMSFDNRWRNFGFIWAYCVFNVAATVLIYWLVRVPKRRAGGAK
ncbi:ABC-2 type transporter [Plectosphaerella plurivora]|uniref:ABC-2 type transporter n=1 Tax=Plectosphaerella plurivora TaxID=936078 RepID=A0A9P8VME0_9PEZI|nr:ABC-2 type transporter [Plectosphaerella plurivora]